MHQETDTRSPRRTKRRGAPIIKILLLLSVVAGMYFGGGKMLRGIVTSFLNISGNETHALHSDEIKPDATGKAQKDWNLILTNPWNPVPDDFSVELETVEDGYSVDSRIVSDVCEMLEDARAEGLDPMICSAYRTQEKQERLYSAKVDKYLAQGYSEDTAEEKAATWVAVPGTSEHQTGLALDIVARNHTRLDKSQQDTAEQQWLMENSYKYGFILRYPIEKTDLTGISFEPWHYRYVGKEAAKEIYDSGVCLEEYLDSLQ